MASGTDTVVRKRVECGGEGRYSGDRLPRVGRSGGACLHNARAHVLRSPRSATDQSDVGSVSSPPAIPTDHQPQCAISCSTDRSACHTIHETQSLPRV